MDLLIIPLLAVCLWGFRFCREGYFSDYLSVDNTRAVRGILALVVVVHHLYMETGSGLLNLLFSNLGCPCVVLFLFFSGYGLEICRQRRPDYGTVVLRRRIPSLLVPFLLLIPLYWVVYRVTGTTYTLSQTLGSLVNGFPIVRSGWYTQCLILLYLVFYLAVGLTKNKPGRLPGTVTVLTLLLAWGFSAMGLLPYWYYSLVAFPLGVCWAVWEPELLPRLERRYGLWLTAGVLVFCLSYVSAIFTYHISLYWLADTALVLAALLVLRKCAFRNRILTFLGGLSFEIYCLHGAFIVLYRSNLIRIESDLLWALAVLASSIPAAWGMQRLLRRK